jgi:methylated-DNA-protein-cysteine methyltransferase related protein
MPLDHQSVYDLVRRIPPGNVATYGQLAKLLGMPRHARHVGFALAALPNALDVPWHRVINSQGRISVRLTHWGSGSDQLQRIRLEHEGVVFSERGSVDLKRFGWDPSYKGNTNRIESPRVSRRLRNLRIWSHDENNTSNPSSSNDAGFTTYCVDPIPC